MLLLLRGLLAFSSLLFCRSSFVGFSPGALYSSLLFVPMVAFALLLLLSRTLLEAFSLYRLSLILLLLYNIAAPSWSCFQLNF